MSASLTSRVDAWRSDLQGTSITYAMLDSVPVNCVTCAKSGSNTLLGIIGRGSTIADAT